MKKLALFLTTIFTITTVYSQNPKLKWGKISDEEKELTEVSFDKDASAVVLNSKGDLSFTSGFVNIDKHYRIKILKEQGIKYSDINLQYYFNTDNISNIKAQIINFDENGKEIITKLKNEDFYETQLDEDYKQVVFTFPDVKVGSIIEYKYTYSSEDLVFINGWVFQNVIPTLYSSLTSVFPNSDVMSYSVYYQGDKLISKYNNVPTDTWELSNLKGLKDDNYVFSVLDYAELIQFQLSEYKQKSATYSMDGSWETKKFAPSWDEFVKTILTYSGIINFINNSKKSSHLLIGLYDDDASNTEKITSIYSFVSQNFVWDGNYKKYTEKTISKIIEEKSGNSCEINMLLFALLKEAGYTVYPLMLSTKSHGRVSIDYPIISEYNHIIVALKIGSTFQLLDATEPFRPYNLLAVEDLNNVGFILDEKNYEWIEINIPETTKQIVNANIDLSKPETQTFEFNFEFDGYIALYQRKAYSSDTLKYFNKLFIQSENYVVDSVFVENFKELEQPFKVSYYFHKNTNEIYENEIAYFEPNLLVKYSESPFKQEERVLPVDLAFTFSENYTLRIYYAENFVVDEIPEKLTKNLFEDLGKFQYSAYNIDNYIKIENKLSIDEPLFFPEEYSGLKDFFNNIVSKNQEQIVLKKK